MSPRIGIVGAGPGGLSLARLLTERGFADVTVLERNPRVGGKSFTVHHQGVGHEMGTCYVATGYTTTRRWMKEAGMREHPLKHHFIRTRNGDLLDFKDFVLGEAGQLGGAKAIGHYVKDWLHFHEWDLLGCPDDFEGTDGGRSMREEAAMPFGAWLDARGLDVIRRFAMRTMTIMGYGPLDRVPTLYGLRWNMPSLIWSAITHKVLEPIPGWQHLWLHVAGDLDVRLGHQITGVERTGSGFEVETTRGPMAFDHLVLSGPLDEAAEWFPFTPEERRAYGVDGGLEWHSYVTTLVDLDGWFKDHDTRSFEAHAFDSAATAQGRLLVARRTGDKSPVAVARHASRPDVYVCYQYGDPNRTKEQTELVLFEDLAREGGRDPKVLAYCPWKYAPQFTVGALRDGAAHALEMQQGKGNLWITGATASHEAVDNIVDYNERLVDRMAVAFAGQDPSGSDVFASLAARHRFTLDDK